MFNFFSFDKLSLTRRLGILVLLPIFLTLIFGFFSFKSIDDNVTTLSDITSRTDMLLLAHSLLSNVHKKVRDPIFDVGDGKKTWMEGLSILREARTEIVSQFELFNTYNLVPLQKNDLGAVAARDAMPTFLKAVDEAIKIIKEENNVYLSLFIKEEMQERMDPLIQAVTRHQEEEIELANKEILKTLNKNTFNEQIILVLLLANLFLLAALGYLVYSSISRQTKSLISTVDALNLGKSNARTSIQGDHELAVLGTALNQLLDEKDQTEKHIQQENETLNNSVFALLESVADLSEKNLTVRATVTEDVTGPLADAINQLALDTSDVLKKVRHIAESVELTSETVNNHTITVKKLAESERLEAQQASKAVSHLMERLNQIAASSLSANNMAYATTQATEIAYTSVSKTLGSMTEIRETVQETGKRIKRLGERSQEITHIIDLINTIAERTTILALNASMQALSAGEAGKGFSVIAEEIQRLAEGSRESTDQIAHLIKNIQQETRTTMTTMDNTIEQVINGSSLAEEASKQMQLTLDATKKLTDSVESIAQSSKEQVGISKNLYARFRQILRATQSTGQEMESLGHLTKNMVNDTQNLVKSVNIFKLDNKSKAV
ncbi:MAG: methyl-accepting chemotaxis protein [Cocleimonas sp.]|nr:methyl-accepting chemotaxis protein [Cocleimonas sp.]